MPSLHFPGPAWSGPSSHSRGMTSRKIHWAPAKEAGGQIVGSCCPLHTCPWGLSLGFRGRGHRGEGKVDTLLSRSQKAHIRRLFGTHVPPGARPGPRKSQGKITGQWRNASVLETIWSSPIPDGDKRSLQADSSEPGAGSAWLTVLHTCLLGRKVQYAGRGKGSGCRHRIDSLPGHINWVSKSLNFSES